MIPGLRELQSRGPGRPATTALDFIRIVRTKRRADFPLPDGVDAVRVIEAEINQGRWIARCPFCTGAELVDLEEPLFYCLSCFNVPIKSKWVRVRLPDDRAKIEAALLKRVLPETRSWYPGETVDDLRRENAEHGVG